MNNSPNFTFRFIVRSERAVLDRNPWKRPNELQTQSPLLFIHNLLALYLGLRVPAGLMSMGLNPWAS